MEIDFGMGKMTHSTSKNFRIPAQLRERANKPAEPRSRFPTCYSDEIGTRLAGCVIGTLRSELVIIKNNELTDSSQTTKITAGGT